MLVQNVKCYLELFRIRNSVIKLNPTTLSWDRVPLDSHEVSIENILPEESMPLILYQKYVWTKKNSENKYDYLFSPSKYEWKLVSTFCSRFFYDEYEDENEKLVATPYESITEQQYQELLAFESRRESHKKR